MSLVMLALLEQEWCDNTQSSTAVVVAVAVGTQ
jgi:hypothetical protein